MDFPLTLPHLLERAGTLFKDVEIVSRLPDKSLHRHTYGDFHRRALALAEVLTKAGLQPGDRVATLMWNHYVHMEAYFGVPAAGGVVHTLNLRLHPSDIAFIANHAEDRFLIVDDVLLKLYEAIAPHTNFERVFVVRLSGAGLPEGLEDYETFIAGAKGGFTPVVVAEDAPLGMCYTSGTTGRPKGVVYSHRSTILHSLTCALPDALNLSRRDVLTPVVPMFHVMAWGLPFTGVMVGCKFVMPGPHLDAESLLDLYQRERVTKTAGVPTIWQGVLSALEAAPERWDLLPMEMVVGGASAPESMIRGFDKFGHTVIHAWGMTEMSPVGTVSRLTPELEAAEPDEQYRTRATQGIPTPLVEVRAMGETGIVPWDGVSMGELEVRGPWVAAAYFRPDEEGQRWSDDGWFRTGDVVTIRPDGYVKITDRSKDLIKSGGEWISSVDLENALMGHPAVKEAAVVAIAHPRWDERPLAAVVLKPGAEATGPELVAHLAPSFAKFWLPDAVVFVEEIPRTSTGKFMKSVLRERYQDWRWE
jgi:fatty-acyl-CoA synthase